MSKYVLAINPGSTSTKVAVFEADKLIYEKSIDHAREQLDSFKTITDQYELRKNFILEWLNEINVNINELSAIVGRGGLLRPMPGGTYVVSEPMIQDLKIGYQGEHASNLGGVIAQAIAEMADVKGYIVDPVAVDEFDDVARISGMPEIVRKSLGHALNIKAVGHSVALELGKHFDEVNLIIAHLGGGISVAPVRKGRILDYNNANEMGPFSPERTGGLPVGELINLCYSGKYTYSEMKTKLRGKGGLTAYLGTNDAREVEKMVISGDNYAKLVFEAMSYQIAKEIGAMATVLNGEIDAIVLTAGMAHSKFVTEFVTSMVEFIAPVILRPGGNEMAALNAGVQRVLKGKEEAKIYENEVKLN